jgi:hypothetical protein
VVFDLKAAGAVTLKGVGRSVRLALAQMCEAPGVASFPEIAAGS